MPINFRRVIDQTEAAALQAGDYLMIDNAETGTKKISGEIIPDKLSDLTEDATHRVVTDTEKAAWNAKSDFSGRYADLTGLPTIPDELADLTSDSTHRVVTDTQITEWNNKSDFSGSYSDLTGQPTIPTALADLTADATHRTVTDAQITAWNSSGGLPNAWYFTSALTGATQIVITGDSDFSPVDADVFDVYSQNSSGTSISYNSIVVDDTASPTTATITFDALKEDTDFKIHVIRV